MSGGHGGRAHAILSPSAADRWIACPGSALANADAPRSDSKASIDGTRGHELVEAAWALHANAADLVGVNLPSGTVTAEDAAAAQVVLDCYAEAEADGWQLQIERTCSPEDIGIHPECWGTPDVWAIKPGIGALVIDAKFGRKPVEPSSTQLLIYGAQRALDAAVPLTCVIAQPHAAEGYRVRRYTWPVSTLGLMLESLRESAARAMRPDAPRVAGSWCDFCNAKDTCSALQARALTIAQAEFTPTGPKVPPKPADLTPEQVGQVLTHADTIEAWLAGVRSRGMRLAEQGTPPPGWKLVKGRQGNRKWADPDAAAQALLGCGIADPYVRELMSPAQAEKALKKEHREMLNLLTERSEGKPELVPEADKRQAISGPAQDFT